MQPESERVSAILSDVLKELNKADGKFPPFPNAHCGYAVILEELDELWDEVKGNGPAERKYQEAVQVAAMAVKFMRDICNDGG